MSTGVERTRSLEAEGFSGVNARWNLSAPALYEEAVRRGEGLIAAARPARLPDRPAHRPVAERQVHRPRAGERSDTSRGAASTVRCPKRTSARSGTTCSPRCAGRICSCRTAIAGADPQYRLPIRVITEYAWHSLFARNLFIVGARRGSGARTASSPSSTRRASAPTRARHGTTSEVVIAINFAERLVLIGGTSYAGEIKKSVFTILNYLLPLRGVLLDALLGEHRARTATSRCSSACRAPARRRCRAIPIAG